MVTIIVGATARPRHPTAPPARRHRTSLNSRRSPALHVLSMVDGTCKPGKQAPSPCQVCMHHHDDSNEEDRRLRCFAKPSQRTTTPTLPPRCQERISRHMPSWICALGGCICGIWCANVGVPQESLPLTQKQQHTRSWPQKQLCAALASSPFISYLPTISHTPFPPTRPTHRHQAHP